MNLESDGREERLRDLFAKIATEHDLDKFTQFVKELVG